MDSTETFRRQVEAMYGRLEKLYAHIDQSATISPDLETSAWHELGVAAEELQVANEELRQQNDQIAELLEESTDQRHYYQHLVNSIPVAYIITTAEGKIQEASSITYRLLRIPQHSSLIGKFLISLVLQDHRIAFRSELNRLLYTGSQPRTWSAWFQPYEGAPIHLSLTTSATSYAEQSPQLHWVLRETTETWETIAPTEHSQGSASSNGSDLMQEHPILSYEKGHLIPLSPQAIWQVHQGLVKLHTLTEENEEVLLGLLGSSMPFGTGSPFLPAYQATAMTDVQLMQFSLAEVKSTPYLAQLLLPKLNRRFQQMEALLAIAGQRRVRNRLYLLLRLLQEEIGEPVSNGIRLSLRLTHEDLANACCTTRVTITRLLGELQRQRKIAIDAKFHIILRENFKL